MEAENYQIDNLDRQILRQLMQDGRKAYSDIAKELLVSPGTIHVRMKKMEEAGIVTGTSLNIQSRKLGYDLTAFIGIFLEKGGNFEIILPRLKTIEEIVEAHYTTGVYGIFVKVICQNTDHLRTVLNEKIQKLEGIQRTETIISLEENISRHVQI